ncbi:EpsG family protein [Aquimarina sp. D1M17]|uniref:EpsG family protein n=1 Tax=Aquimarina acroporae TaxID=2937283 RepID=UPI0020BD6494|nr:EpsG family protein [Aquimarina acroporae]MCK8520580.1 EpsG family protein [Aquimarina acroporae]
MNTIVPIELYYPLYLNLCFFLVLFTLLHTRILNMNEPRNLSFINYTGYVLLAFLIFHIGQRPPSHLFGDTINYYRTFQHYNTGGEILQVNDYGWHLFMKAIASVSSVHTFFTICAIIYVFPMYRISKEFFKDYWYYAFIMFVVSFSFWTYGVNGMRNGAACSLFLWGVSYHRNKVVMSLFFLVAIFFHKTTLLPIFAFVITYFYNNPKVFFKGWLACIPLSLAMGGVWITLFASLGFGDDDRLAGYLTSEAAEGTFSSTGFRWDFLFHSSFAVFAGWYFVIKKKFEDKLYFKLLNTYLICNGFWILVIKANYSNRFAYLSWFMMAIIIAYPFLKKQFFKDQHFLLGKVILVYFSFTFFMYYLFWG